MIKSIHGSSGGLGNTTRAKRIGGCWGSIARLPLELHKQDLQFCEFLQLSSDANGTPKWSWILEKSGVYSVSSYRNYVDMLTLPVSQPCWHWNSLVPRKVNVLAWRTSHRRLPTLVNLERVGICRVSLCKICGAEPEDEDHIFTRCPLAAYVWSELGHWWHFLDPSPASVTELLQAKQGFAGPANLTNIHEAIILVFIWAMWSFRNKAIFKQVIKNQFEIVAEIQILSHLWFNARKRRGCPLNWLAWRADPVLECRSANLL